MPFTTITISTEAQRRLAGHKVGRESYSAVILREIPEPPLETAGQIETHFKTHGVPKADPKLRQAMLAGRGRRSKRRE
jgi:predicted CopG family antitoxin